MTNNKILFWNYLHEQVGYLTTPTEGRKKAKNGTDYMYFSVQK